MLAIYGCLVNKTKKNLLDSLIGYGHLDNIETLKCISDTYADGIGVWKNNLLPHCFTDLIDNAHQAGLFVHCYTLRPEKIYSNLKIDGRLPTMTEEIEQLIDRGVDGFFCDNPAICRQVVDSKYLDQNKRYR